MDCTFSSTSTRSLRWPRTQPVPAPLKADAFWSRVLESWLTENAVPRRPAWHPFPTSGRVMAWCAALGAGGWDPGLEATPAIEPLAAGDVRTPRR